jgi:hypothetical protein
VTECLVEMTLTSDSDHGEEVSDYLAQRDKSILERRGWIFSSSCVFPISAIVEMNSLLLCTRRGWPHPVLSWPLM